MLTEEEKKILKFILLSTYNIVDTLDRADYCITNWYTSIDLNTICSIAEKLDCEFL